MDLAVPDTRKVYYTGSRSTTVLGTPSEIWALVRKTPYTPFHHQENKVVCEDLEEEIFINRNLLRVARTLPNFRGRLKVRLYAALLLRHYHDVMISAAFIAGFERRDTDRSHSVTATKVSPFLWEAIHREVSAKKVSQD